MGPNSTMAGTSMLNHGAHVGPNASILDGKVVNKHSVLGMNSCATKDLDEFSVYFGLPAKNIGIIQK